MGKIRIVLKERESGENLEKEREGAFSSDSHEDHKSEHVREARYFGRYKGSEQDELIQSQAETVKEEYEKAMAEKTKGQKCPHCGMKKIDWEGNDGQGVAKNGKIYCCEGCSDDTICTCV